MGKKAYIGVGGKARDIKQIYIGVNGVARKVKKAYIGVNGVARLAYQAGTPIGTLPVGSIVKIKENGAWVDYLIVHQGLPGSMYDASCNGTWVLRKDLADFQPWNNVRYLNDYAVSSINAYLNSTILGRYDAAVQAAIKQVKIPYRPGNSGDTIYSGANGLSTKVFLPAAIELGIPSSTLYFPLDGAKLSYFLEGYGEADRKRMAYYEGNQYMWWTRSPYLNSNETVWLIATNGSLGNSGSTAAAGIRPVCILPSSLTIEDGGYVTG